MFPVIFSAAGRSQHQLLAVKDFAVLANAAYCKPFEADTDRINTVLRALQAFRRRHKTTGGEIRIYGRSLHTSEALVKTIHPRIRQAGFVEVIGLSDPKQNWSKYQWPRVYISNNGKLTRDDHTTLHCNLSKKVLVVMSGGEGKSDDPFYAPLAELIETLLEKRIPLFCVCMSYQVLADRVVRFGATVNSPKILPPLTGSFRLGTQIVDITSHGQTDPVFGAFAPAFAVESMNQYRIAGSLARYNTVGDVTVLGRDRATREMVALRVGDRCWAMQYHPELKKKARVKKGLQHKRSVIFNGDRVIIPAGMHAYQVNMISRVAKAKTLCARYHLHAKDVQAFFHPARQVYSIGEELMLRLLEQSLKLAHS
jgi:GMP synthase-like glutamine amidotransferase